MAHGTEKKNRIKELPTSKLQVFISSKSNQSRRKKHEDKQEEEILENSAFM